MAIHVRYWARHRPTTLGSAPGPNEPQRSDGYEPTRPRQGHPCVVVAAAAIDGNTRACLEAAFAHTPANAPSGG